MTSRAAGLRPLVTTALLAVAAAGVSARSLLSWHGVRPVAFAGTTASATVAVVAVLQLVLLVVVLRQVRRRRPGSPEGEHVPSPVPVSRRERAAALVGCVLLLTAPWALLALATRSGQGSVAIPTPAPAATGSRAGVPSAATHLPDMTATLWPLLALGVVLLAVLVAAALLAHRHRARPEVTGRRAVPPAAAPPGASRVAAPPRTGPPGSPREAVIAYWTALGVDLNRRGVPPVPADTPARLLHRAEAAGVLPPGPGPGRCWPVCSAKPASAPTRSPKDTSRRHNRLTPAPPPVPRSSRDQGPTVRVRGRGRRVHRGPGRAHRRDGGRGRGPGRRGRAGRGGRPVQPAGRARPPRASRPAASGGSGRGLRRLPPDQLGPVLVGAVRAALRPRDPPRPARHRRNGSDGPPQPGRRTRPAGRTRRAGRGPVDADRPRPARQQRQQRPAPAPDALERLTRRLEDL
ncbi:hypothetical protein GXW82_33095 [Streptacidiphilus sp. 4-A2]|nr:hypothetical protein [Streptacidiphilus sp. 4-A2]